VTLHASIDGNAVWALLRLGLADERIERLVARLVSAQWPDGGWNCDRRASGQVSSFTESLIPLRALALHAIGTGNGDSRAAADRAAELFLARRLFRRLRDGRVIRPAFVQLHFPCYWQPRPATEDLRVLGVHRGRLAADRGASVAGKPILARTNLRMCGCPAVETLRAFTNDRGRSPMAATKPARKPATKPARKPATKAAGNPATKARKPAPSDGRTPEQHLRDALEELGKARDRAGGDLRGGIESAIERTREAMKHAGADAQEQVSDWRRALDKASDDVRRELGILAVRAQSSPEALRAMSAEIRSRKAQITPSK
jgi:hypothetical protein